VTDRAPAPGAGRAGPEDGPGAGEEGSRRPGPIPAGFEPLREYAAIGDCHGAALVSRSGSVDWCSLGRFDADPVLCRILDRGKGGFLSVRPEEAFEARRRYLEGTNVLRTVFETPGGRAAVTDFMPVGRREGSGVHDYVTLASPFWLVRIVEGLEGRVPLRIAYRPTVDFGRRRPEMRIADGRVETRDGPFLAGDVEWEPKDGLAVAGAELGPGSRLRLVLSATPVPEEGLGERLERSLEITRAFWDDWTHY
jgi:GH15 family glucan-1,4-alpha-glucosidase